MIDINGNMMELDRCNCEVDGCGKESVPGTMFYAIDPESSYSEPLPVLFVCMFCDAKNYSIVLQEEEG